jgi:hypothetical protein
MIPQYLAFWIEEIILVWPNLAVSRLINSGEISFLISEVKCDKSQALPETGS